MVLSCAVLSAQDLTILHLNDTHSHIDPERSGENKGLGGVIEQSAYVDSVRCVDGKGNVILLHAGDFSQGSSYFTELNGDIEVDVLNAMKFDAVCLGNHEFDNGIDELARRLRNLKVPVLCANYDFSQTVLKDLVKPYEILVKAWRKIGVQTLKICRGYLFVFCDSIFAVSDFSDTDITLFCRSVFYSMEMI